MKQPIIKIKAKILNVPEGRIFIEVEDIEDFKKILEITLFVIDFEGKYYSLDADIFYCYMLKDNEVLLNG